MPANLLETALARPDLLPTSRALLLDLQRALLQGRTLSTRQIEAVERIATAPSWPNFATVNRAALARLPDVLGRLLPAGRAVRGEWHAGSVKGEPGDSLRVRLHGDRAGVWCDFATGEKGRDPVSLAAAVVGLSQTEAARGLVRMLGLGGSTHGR